MNRKLIQFIFHSIGLSFIMFSQVYAEVVEFPDFSNTTGLVLNGDAEIVSSVDGSVLRLTPAQTGKAGSAFSQTTVNASDFSTFFKFRITEPGGSIFDCNTKSGADGIVFVVQSVSSDIGGSGGGIGYSGIENSVGVEFDTWCNTANNDPDSNHLGVVMGGSVRHSDALENSILPVSPDFDNGNIWYVWVDYDGVRLEIRANQTGVRPGSANLSVVIDIPDQLGGDEAFIGFTSGTGSDYGNHDIINWEYRDNFNPIPGDGSQVCEAVTLTSDLILSIPRIEWNPGVFFDNQIIPLSAEFRHVPTDDGRILFEVIDFRVLPE